MLYATGIRKKVIDMSQSEQNGFGNGKKASRNLSRRTFLRAGASVVCLAGLGALSQFGEMPVAEAETYEGVDLRLDDLASLYVGGNLNMVANGESEGVCVVRGDFNGALQHVAGRVEWGLGGEPQPGTPSLLVGGNIACNGQVYCGTSAQIGGSVTSGNLAVATWENQQALGGYTSRAYVYGWGISEATLQYAQTDPAATDAQRRCSVRTGMGRSSALRCTTAAGQYFDYETYLDTDLRPLSERLAAKASTGSILVTPMSLRDNTYYEPSMVAGRRTSTLDSDWDARLTLTGDGVSDMQVFDLDLDWLDGQLSACGRSQIDVDVCNCPEGSLVVVNVSGHGDRTWRYGWNVYVNGSDVTGRPNMLFSRYAPFRAICSRMIWNFYQLDGTLSVDRAHGIATYEAVQNWASVGVGNDVYNNAVGGANVWPGSILLPYGSAVVHGSTNGHLLVGGDLTAAWWEHHNVIWLGLATGNGQIEKKAQRSDWL